MCCWGLLGSHGLETPVDVIAAKHRACGQSRLCEGPTVFVQHHVALQTQPRLAQALRILALPFDPRTSHHRVTTGSTLFCTETAATNA